MFILVIYTALTFEILNWCERFRLTVIAVDEHSAGSPLRMPEENGAVDSSKRSMGLLRLGRSRWSPAESSKRSMGLLRLGRSDSDASTTHEDEKKSMGLLRLGRKRNDGDYLEMEPDSMADQKQLRCVSVK